MLYYIAADNENRTQHAVRGIRDTKAMLSVGPSPPGLPGALLTSVVDKGWAGEARLRPEPPPPT